MRRVALIFSPHPDDECIIGGAGAAAAARGGLSRRQRRGHAGQQQGAAGGALGGAARRLRLPRLRAGRDRARRAREGQRRRRGSADPAAWQAVGRRDRRASSPTISPRSSSSRTTPTGTARTSAPTICSSDALARQAAAFTLHGRRDRVLGRDGDAEPDGRIAAPQDLGDMMAALSFHVGEVQRNPVSPAGAGVDAGQRAPRRRAGRRPGRRGAGLHLRDALPRHDAGTAAVCRSSSRGDAVSRRRRMPGNGWQACRVFRLTRQRRLKSDSCPDLQESDLGSLILAVLSLRRLRELGLRPRLDRVYSSVFQ